MRRLSAFFIALCMVLIAGSVGAVLFLAAGLGAVESGGVAIAVLTAMALYNGISARSAGGGALGEQIADLSRGTADLARQVAEMARRLNALEGDTRSAVDKSVAATRPISAEIGELGQLVKELAVTVAAQDTALRKLSPTYSPAPPAAYKPAAMVVDIPPIVPPPSLMPAVAPEPVPPEPPATVAADAAAPLAPTAVPAEVSEPPAVAANRIASGRFKGLEPEAVAAMLREAVAANRVDLYLQPVVTLPQRKVRYYEALTRLRTADGEVLAPTDFLPYAESAGLMPKIDNLMLFRCVQVVRRLLGKSREVGLFCNVSASTLADPEVFPQFTEFMAANRAIAPSMVFEFTQAAYRAMGPIENESLAALADQGFRFSMDHVTDLRIEPRDLADRGVRFVKAPGSLLLNRAGTLTSDIHPADFAGLLSRFGIELIGTHIEGESSVVDLLDYEVKFGQGFLFSPPRPVRPEVMQGVADRDAVREPAAPPPADGPALTAGAPMGAPPLTAEARPMGQRISALAQLAKGVVARG